MVFRSLLLSFRQLHRNPGSSLFNISCFAIGICTFTLLTLYIQRERSFDSYNYDADKLYRIVNNYHVGNEHNSTAWTSAALAGHIQADIPEVSECVRLFRYRSPSVMVERGSNKNFSEAYSVWADANVFRVFKFDFVRGNPDQSLGRPYTMVITETTARKYFGTSDPVGKILSDLTMEADFEITGVVRDMPANAHFRADFICSLSTLPKLWGEGIMTNWGNSFLYSYVSLNDYESAALVETRINEMAAKHIPSTPEASTHFSLQPVLDIHLHSNLLNEWQPNSDIRYVYILTLVAILILLVSSINYMNQWIARSEERRKEIGIRQAIGGNKKQLATQFAVEIMVHVFLAFVSSIVLAVACEPLIEATLGENFPGVLGSGKTWMLVAGSVIVIMLVVLIYPLVIIAGIRPVLAIKGAVVRLQHGFGLWKGLITFQILVTALLITGTLLINKQLSFIQDQPVGYDANHLVNISQVSDPSLCERLKNELVTNPGVTNASGVSHLVGGMLYQSGYIIYKKDATETVLWQRIHTDHDFCKTYGIPIVSGRDFSKAIALDTANCIINEAATRSLGFSRPDDAVGLEITLENGAKGKIVGVMKDFHFKTLHSVIEPLIIHIVPGRVRMLTVNISSSDFERTMKEIEQKWKSLEPSVPFVHTSLSGFNNQNYQFEKKFGKVVTFFTLIVFFLSASGLVSLNLYVISLKRKEIGIRKVLGAPVSGLLFDLSKPFTAITAIAFLLSVPLSWYVLNLWLEGFAYRVNLTGDIFVMAAVIIFVLSMISIALPSLKAALKNPSDVLKVD